MPAIACLALLAAIAGCLGEADARLEVVSLRGEDVAVKVEFMQDAEVVAAWEGDVGAGDTRRLDDVRIAPGHYVVRVTLDGVESLLSLSVGRRTDAVQVELGPDGVAVYTLR